MSTHAPGFQLFFRFFFASFCNGQTSQQQHKGTLKYIRLIILAMFLIELCMPALPPGNVIIHRVSGPAAARIMWASRRLLISRDARLGV